MWEAVIAKAGKKPVPAITKSGASEGMNKYDRPLVTLDNNPLLAYFKVESDEPRSPKDEVDGLAVRDLFEMQRAGIIRLMVGLSTALEKQRPGEEKEMHAFATQLEALGIDREDIFTAPRTIGFSSLDEPGTIIFNVEQERMLNEVIHSILFKGKVEPDARNVPFEWWRFRDEECERRGITGIEKDAVAELDRLRLSPFLVPSPLVLDKVSPARKEELAAILTKMNNDWMNKKNDALGLYNHLTHAYHTSVPQHAVFVTSDKNFKKRNNLFEKTAWELLQSMGFPGHILEPEEAVTYFRSLPSAEHAAQEQ